MSAVLLSLRAEAGTQTGLQVESESEAHRVLNSLEQQHAAQQLLHKVERAGSGGTSLSDEYKSATCQELREPPRSVCVDARCAVRGITTRWSQKSEVAFCFRSSVLYGSRCSAASNRQIVCLCDYQISSCTGSSKAGSSPVGALHRENASTVQLLSCSSV